MAGRIHPVAAALAALAILGACGGGGGGGTPSGPSGPAPTPAPTPTPTPAGNPPTIRVTLDRSEGQSPLKVSFDLCQSTDASGGKNLRYSASFEGEPAQALGGCGFSHDYRTAGVSQFDTQLCVADASTGAQACQTVSVKTYVSIALQVARDGGCDGVVDASATAGQAFAALGNIDRMLFEARNENGTIKVTMEGNKSGTSKWLTGEWKTGITTRAIVKVTAFSGAIPGAVADNARPGC